MYTADETQAVMFLAAFDYISLSEITQQSEKSLISCASSEYIPQIETVLLIGLFHLNYCLFCIVDIQLSLSSTMLSNYVFKRYKARNIANYTTTAKLFWKKVFSYEVCINFTN